MTINIIKNLQFLLYLNTASKVNKECFTAFSELFNIQTVSELFNSSLFNIYFLAL